MNKTFYLEHFILKPYRLAMARPFLINGEPLAYREGVLLEIISRDGHSGYGEAAPLPGVSLESVKKALHQLKCLEREWVGRSLPLNCRALCTRLVKDLDRSILAPSVIFALESALISLAARAHGQAPSEFLSGIAPENVNSACLLQGDIQTIQADGARYQAAGYSVFKLKVGSKNIPLDIAKVEALRALLGFHDKLRLDANAAWDLPAAITFASAIGKGQVDFIEEPCRNWQDNEIFFRQTDMPWAIEINNATPNLHDLEGAQGLAALIVKPMITGGISDFMALKKTAFRMGVKIIVSSAFETATGLTMLANLAAVMNSTSDQLHCGLGTADWFGTPAAGILQKGGIIPAARLIP
ncbi:MAG: o-succinylbenzoate synthase [Candidatus Omnitrophica bacterium]|nr:o-succinylbenzoate synthase [Candidatus Omnitrophota bacterium]